MTIHAFRQRLGLLFVGIWIEKGVGLIVPGFIPSQWGQIVECAPTWVEISVTLGIWAMGAFIFTLLVKLAEATVRLGDRSGEVEWFEEDVTTFESPNKWALWHDRALFHFLIDLPARIAYKQSLLDAVEDEGHAIIATFGPEGPTTCSGLDVKRYSGADLDAFFGPELCLLEEALEDHKTPLGATQQFVYCRFQRV